MLRRSGGAVGRLLLNWGALAALIAGVLTLRHHADVAAETPLPPPRVHLSTADLREWQRFPAYTGSIPVLVYHGINNASESYSVTPRLFAEQMLALKVAGFHAISLAQYAQFVHGDRRGLPPKPILLTFDDGRRDAYRVAANLLRAYGFHAVMFTFGAWPITNPGFSLTWNELQRIQRSPLWSVQEHGGRGHEYTIYSAAGARGAVYAYLRYLPDPSGHGGHLESFPHFVQRFTSDVLWGAHQFASHIPGFRPIAFAVPYGDYGQELTNDPQIPALTLPWLDHHFQVVFGGDYLDRITGSRDEIPGRFSPRLSYRITMQQSTQLPTLYCRLKDWVTGVVLWKEYACLRLGSGDWGPVIGQGQGQFRWHPPEPVYKHHSNQHTAIHRQESF
jgi:peptidoglycan/xylan/chitin deacetylase (PgdA/CDA1 family)